MSNETRKYCKKWKFATSGATLDCQLEWGFNFISFFDEIATCKQNSPKMGRRILGSFILSKRSSVLLSSSGEVNFSERHKLR